MQDFLIDLFSLLIKPPGNLIYYLVLAFSITIALQMTFLARQNGQKITGNRMVAGLLVLLTAQLVLFISSGLAWQGLLNPHLFLPPFERGLITFSLVWIAWLWCFPEPSRWGDILAGVFSGIVVLIFLVTYTFWSRQEGNLSFNLSIWDWLWQIYLVFVSLMGLIVLLLKRPANWVYGFTMIFALLSGSLMHLLLPPTEGDFSGVFRLVSLVAFPFLPSLSSRLISSPIDEKGKNIAAPANRGKERRRYSADPRTIQSWIQLISQTNEEAVCSALIRSVARTMLSDWSFAVVPPDQQGQITLISGFDLIQEQSMPVLRLDAASVPSLQTALNRKRPLRLQAAENPAPDIKALAEILNLSSPSSIMFVPFSREYFSAVGILLISPYSHREWSMEDQSYVSTMLEFLTIPRLTDSSTTNQVEIENLRQQLQVNTSLLEQLQKENNQLKSEIAELRTVKAAKPDEDIQALLALQQETQEAIIRLQKENEQLRANLQATAASVSVPPASVNPDMQRFEEELTASLKENAYLKNALAQSNTQILELREQLRKPSTAEEEDIRDMVEALAVELRQPMSSVIGYTDLLLSESVGILGALQKKFMERIKASTERLNTLLDDLLRLSRLSGEKISVSSQSVDFNAVLDHAISDTSAQLREKSITLELDLPDNLPQPNADRDTLQLILIHLLQNAALATPMEGTITLNARPYSENRKEYLKVSITDSGGGVLAEDIPRVFSRRYRNENPLIPGIGDTGVGLVITKTLVEAHGGRIWLESEPGQSTTFHIIIPLPADQPLENQEK